MFKQASSLVLPLLLLACDKGPTPQVAQAPVPSASPAPGAPAPAAPSEPAAPTAAVATAAPAGVSYGAGVKLTESTSIAAVLAKPHDFNGKTIRVEGLITDVCEKRGCWMALAGEQPGQILRFKVTDGVIVIPVADRGKYAVAEGTVTVKQLTLEETKNRAKYLAEEQGEPFDPESVKVAELAVRLDGLGAVIRDKK